MNKIITDIVVYMTDIVVYIVSHMWSIILLVMLITAGYSEFTNSRDTTSDSPLMAESESEIDTKDGEMSIVVVQDGKQIASASGSIISSNSEHVCWKTKNGIHTIYYKNAPVIVYLGPKPTKRK